MMRGFLARRLHVPLARIGRVDVPRLFLGDNGFLGKFGSTLGDDAVVERMTQVVRTAAVGLAAGDERLLWLAQRARAAAGHAAPLMYHADVPVLLDGAAARYRVCGATLHARLADRHIDVCGDPVLAYLERFRAANGLTVSDMPRLTLDGRGIAQFNEIVRRYRPAVVTIGGDWLDMLLLLGAKKLAARALAKMLPSCRAVGAAVACTLYVGAVTTYVVPAAIDAVMAPLNADGVAMLPDREAALRWAADTNKPIIAMHALGNRSRPVLESLRQAGAHANVVVVGASRRPHIKILLRALAGRAIEHSELAGAR